MNRSFRIITYSIAGVVAVALLLHTVLFSEYHPSTISAEQIAHDYFSNEKLTVQGLGYKKRLLPLGHPFSHDYLITFTAAKQAYPRNFENYAKCIDGAEGTVEKLINGFGTQTLFGPPFKTKRTFLAPGVPVLGKEANAFECYEQIEDDHGSCRQMTDIYLYDPASGRHFFRSFRYDTCPM